MFLKWSPFRYCTDKLETWFLKVFSLTYFKWEADNDESELGVAKLQERTAGVWLRTFHDKVQAEGLPTSKTFSSLAARNYPRHPLSCLNPSIDRYHKRFKTTQNAPELIETARYWRFVQAPSMKLTSLSACLDTYLDRKNCTCEHVQVHRITCRHTRT
jgi:hypothetical protein